MQVIKERDDSQPLTGIIQLDDAYWGGERRGGQRGRGAPGKIPFVAAVATKSKHESTETWVYPGFPTGFLLT